jgi:hypothetical protein
MEHEPGCPGNAEEGDGENDEEAESVTVEEGGGSVTVEQDANKENKENMDVEIAIDV